MLTFSYTINPSLKKEIEKIDETRNKILLELIPRNLELQARWEANLDRATQATRLTDNKLKRSEVVEGLNRENRRTSDATTYFKTYQWINQNWLLNEEKVDFLDFKKLYSAFGDLNIKESEARPILEFIQVNPEHPIVQAGLASVLLSNILPPPRRVMLSLLLGMVFLYKQGYDFRGLLALEEFLANDFEHFQSLMKSSYQQRNLSGVLEYFANGVAISAEHALRKISQRQFKNDLPASFYLLSERQNEILILFDKPGIKISNRVVQKKFKVSQITASRDLAKLHTLGLIFSAGRGRSVYYTKI